MEPHTVEENKTDWGTAVLGGLVGAFIGWYFNGWIMNIRLDDFARQWEDKLICDYDDVADPKTSKYERRCWTVKRIRLTPP